MLDLILTNEEEMIDKLHVKDPLGHSDHCVSEERWNYFKGNYEQMKKKIGFRLG